MKKKKNGFTFAELLGAIIIIGILALITIPTVERLVKESKEKIYEQQLDNIVLSLKSWASDNREYLPEKDGEVLTVTLSNLKTEGYIEYDVKNPKTKKCFDNSMILQVTKNKNTYNYSIDLDTIKETEDCIYDVDVPVIIINGNPIENIEINSVYKDSGVTAKDKNGNDITDDVVITVTGSGNVVDTSKLGSKYVINYSVTANDKTTTTSRTIKIVDTKEPVITLPSNVLLTTADTSYDIMNGVSASDNSGKPIEVSAKSNIAFGIPGKYTITYTASDESGNTVVQRRIVTINKVVNNYMSADSNCIKDVNSKCAAGTPVTVMVNATQNYNFYVIDDTGSKLTLIMDRNLGEKVQWNSTGNTLDGPTTALTELKRVTSNWNNISEKIYTYNDDGGGNMYVNLTMSMRARMITINEALSLKDDNSSTLPLFLSTNLSGEDTVEKPYGYWTSTANPQYSSLGWTILTGGWYSSDTMINGTWGVRPVIEIYK